MPEDPSPANPPNEDEERARARAIEARQASPEATAVEKVLAIIEGAAEGFAQQSQEGNLPQAASEAADKAAGTFRAVRDGISEGRAEPAGAGPNGPIFPEAAQTMGSVSKPTTTEGTTPSLGTTESTNAGEGIDARTRQLQAVSRAVGESAGRARRTSATLQHDARALLAEAKEATTRVAFGGVAMGAFGIFAFGLLTAAIAYDLDRLVGIPWGTFALAVIYALVAWAIYAWMMGTVHRLRATVRQRIASARRQLASVAEPLRGARSHPRA
ncbi:MAG: phage holin family protein [Thermoplasmatota archaeon]